MLYNRQVIGVCTVNSSSEQGQRDSTTLNVYTTFRKGEKLGKEI
jgi:hypothetical protein